jgi:NAD(P)-dependent dehydrogenase (short-subunit alcohol dehydrogenase family)
MERTLLITDGDTPVGAELVRIFAAQGCRVVTSTAEAAGRVSPSKSVLTVAWNRRSSASARNLVLSALNGMGSIDEAIVLSAPPGPEPALHEVPAADVEKAFDLCLKPAVFLTRELLAHFIPRGGGILSLASFSPRPSEGHAPALERAVREGFKGFATSVLAAYSGSGFFVNAFQSFGASAEEFAQFIERTLEEKARKISGRWFTCQPRAGLFRK